tara:strand:+ start:843 stop:2555 length:1713 start_codon:yes stop_codon:yes gene_type:complete
MTFSDKRKTAPKSPSDKPRAVVLAGLESVGRSSLLSALTGRVAESAARTDTTLYCEHYRDASWEWVDTTGLVTGSDAFALKDALTSIESAETVLLVLRANRAAKELTSLLPIINSKKVAVALTFRHQLTFKDDQEKQKAIASWNDKLGVPVTLLDGRSLDATELADLRTSVMQAKPMNPISMDELSAFEEKQRRLGEQTLERVLGFAPIGILLLFVPAWISVTQANALADHLYDSIELLLGPLVSWFNTLPEPLAVTMGGDYGIFAMFPFLLLYALPTILIFTGLIAIYKSTGLVDRLSYGVHRWLKPFGLGGRDLVRVVMGFGCNVPAVVATRSCSGCSRGACVSAICFGSACSYQLPATLAVFAAAGFAWLAAWYLAILAITSLVYLRLTTPTELRHARNEMLLPELGHLQLPDWQAVARDIIQTIREFLVIALPIFLGICIVAGLLQWSGVLNSLTRSLAPVMAIFNLPSESALAVVLGAVRKDGIAIGLLNGDMESLKVPMDTSIHVLTAVYLAGVLLPCLVTVLTVAKEMGTQFAMKMLGRQACFAAGSAICIAWIGTLILSIIK